MNGFFKFCLPAFRIAAGLGDQGDGFIPLFPAGGDFIQEPVVGEKLGNAPGTVQTVNFRFRQELQAEFKDFLRAAEGFGQLH